MFCMNEPSPEQKTLLVSIISLLSTMGLDTVDKNVVARSLVAGQTINAEIAFEDQEAAERQKAREELARLEQEMAQLNKQLERIKRRLK